MVQNFSIKQQMMFFILGTALLTYLSTIGYIGYNLKNAAIQSAKELADTYAHLKANDVRARLNEDVAIARTMSEIVTNYASLPREERDSLTMSLMVNVLASSPKYEAVFLSWELEAIDSNWHLPYGRERVNYYMRDGVLQSSRELANLEGDDAGSTYARIKKRGLEELSEPYTWADYDYSSHSNDSIFGTSPLSPIMQDGKFIGVIGTDLTLEDFEDTYKVDFYKKGFSFLITNGGLIISHKEKQLINTSVKELAFAKFMPFDIIEKIQSGENFSTTVYDEDFGEEVYISFAPLEIGRSGRFWSAATVVPVSEITASFNTTFNTTLIVAVIGLLFLVFVIWKIARPISKSVKETSLLLTDLAQGKLESLAKLKIERKDEIGVMANSLNVLMDDMKEKAKFAQYIKAGNLDTSYSPSSGEDLLGISLVDMRDNLKTVIDETKGVILQADLEGDLNARISTKNKKGAWYDLSDLINNLLQTMATPIQSVNIIVNAMAEGNLTLRYVENAEGDIKHLSDNLNLALSNLNEFLNEINTGSSIVKDSSIEILKTNEEMVNATAEVASAIAQMSHGAQDQVAKMEESSRLVERVLNSSNTMNNKANSINQAAKVGLERGEQGVEMAKKISFSIEDISRSTNMTNESIETLTQRSSEISLVLGVITEIASQTNLLALNAAIEAAQAGEAGRGFAVVAEEIRKLAEDSRNSARQIESLISDVQKDTEGASKVIKEMIESVRNGKNASNEASEVFKVISDSSAETFTYSEEILSASKQQIDDMHKVVNIIEGIVVIAEQTAVGSEEVASSATELSTGMARYKNESRQLTEVASGLINNMSKFKLDGKSY